MGRTQELALLHERLEQAVSGQGQVIGIAGEPGWANPGCSPNSCTASRPGRDLCEGHGLAYGSASPYMPVRDLLRQLWNLPDAAPVATITTTVHQRLYEAGVASEDEALVLLQLLDVPVDLAPLAALDPAEAQGTDLCTAVAGDPAGQSAAAPLLAVENLHWIDPTSEAWLASLVERLGDVPVLLLVTYRPGVSAALDQALDGDPAGAAAAVTPRQPGDAAVRAAGRTAPGPVQEAIVTTAAGNPFFVEELTWAAVEHGDPAGPLPLPDTIEAVLAARIDRLPPEEKRLLQTAAVIGPAVPVPLLQRLVGLHGRRAAAGPGAAPPAHRVPL